MLRFAAFPAALAAAATLEYPLTNSFNTEYYTEVTLGGQSFHMQFDAGSADVFVGSSLCDSCGNPSAPYDVSTGEKVGTDFALQFVQWGSVTGTLYNDTLEGMPDYTFAAVSEYEGMLNVTEFSGKVGLGLPSASRSGAPTFLERLDAEGKLDAMAWVAEFPSAKVQPGQTQPKAGSLRLGAFDDADFDVFFPIQADAGMYVMDGDSVSLGDSVLVEGDDLVGVIVDTGTPGVLLSEDSAAAANALLGCEDADWPNWTPQVCGWAASCADVAGKGDFPMLTLAVGDTTFAVGPDSYLVDFDDSKPHQCASMIQGTDLLGGNVLVGDAFLRNYAVAYDVDGWRMGFKSQH